jgi:hypothetical protein
VFDKLSEDDRKVAENVIHANEIKTNNKCDNHLLQQQQIVDAKKAEQLPSPHAKHNNKNNVIDNGITNHDIDDWNSLLEFENFIKLEMENLEVNAKNEQNEKKQIGASKNNILKPEKHVSCVMR